MSDSIQLQRLEGFYWVARTGGYARAARAFPYPITQPAVHQQVKKLEAELGISLFERVAKDRMALTSGGARLYEFVAPFFEGLPPLVRSLRAGEYGGELRVECAAMVLRYMLPEWLGRMREKLPGADVHVQESPAPRLDLLRGGTCDVLVDYIPEVPDDLASMQVGSTRPLLVLPAGHELASREKLELPALADESFVSYSPDTHERALQLEALRREGVQPRRILSASSADGILALVEAGLGYSIVPAIEESHVTDREIHALPLPGGVEFPVLALWRKDMPENPLIDAFLESAPRPGSSPD